MRSVGRAHKAFGDGKARLVVVILVIVIAWSSIVWKIKPLAGWRNQPGECDDNAADRGGVRPSATERDGICLFVAQSCHAAIKW